MEIRLDVESHWGPTNRAPTNRPRVRLWYAADDDTRGMAHRPLLIYFPGWHGTQIENHGLINELASHGFIVAGVVYPKESAEAMDYSSAAAYRRTQQVGTARVSARAADAVTLLDVLARLNAIATPSASPRGTQLPRSIDLSHIGILGFSLGGAVAAEASTLDPRFRAVVNIDGRHWGRALELGVSQPYLFIGEELTMPTDADLAATDPTRRYNAIEDRRDYSQLAHNLRRHGGMQVSVSDAHHSYFTDVGGSSRIRRWMGRGARHPARRVLLILNAYVLAFFRHTLMLEPSPLLVPGAQPFPRAQLRIWTR